MFNDFNLPAYEITPNTLAILAQKDNLGQVSTCVLEDKTEYMVDYPPSKIIDFACKFFGSSLRGRQDGTRDVCGITYKAPISVDPISGMYFFPTSSPTSKDCSWIAHSHVDIVNRTPKTGSEIIFKNGRRIHLKTSYGSLMNQIQRTAQFRYLLDNRIKYLQQRMTDQVSEPHA